MAMSFAVRSLVAVHILCNGVDAGQLRQRRSGELQEAQPTAAPPPSAVFSQAAQAALQNMTSQLAEFQRVVVEHSSRFQALLQQQEQANAGIQAISAQLAAGNQKLEAGNAALAKEAQGIMVNNSQLRTELKGMERKLRVAQLMAATVGAFHAESAEQDENAMPEELTSDGDVAAARAKSLLVIQTHTTLAGGAKDLAQEEEDAIAQLQKSGEMAFAAAKKKHAELAQEQAQLNATRLALEARKAKLTATIARLSGAHARLQARYTSLTSLFLRLASVAGGR